MGRAPCCSKVGLKRGPWSDLEDTLLTDYIQKHGEGHWRSLPKNAGLLRCGKSCRLRWMNYLRPGIKRGNISEDEEDLIVRLHGLLGNRWSLIAGRLPGRTDNEIKNYWNTHLLKKLTAAGVRPVSSRDLAKPDKSDGKKTKKVVKKTVLKAENDEDNGGERTDINVNPPKTKVYLPKAVRVSSEFSSTNSYDSLASGTSGDQAAEVASHEPEEWAPLFDLEDSGFGVYPEEDFLVGEYTLPILNYSDSLSEMERVYDEYYQLL